MIWLYNILVLFLSPLWLLILWKNQKKLGLKERLGFYQKRRDKPIWVHAVSLGEAKIGVNLINLLKEKGFEIFATSTTASGKGEFEKNGIICNFFPIDFILFTKIALKRIEPSALVVIETEIWPSLFYLCKIKDIPVFIVNARISEIKINKYIRYKRLFADTINKIWILCSSEEYKDRYMKVGADSGRIIITGNMKFDITFPEESKISKFKISVRDFLKEEFKIWVAGSVREGEEEKILRCHKKISQHIEKSKLIIAPRHLNRVGKIIEMCNIIGLKPALRSEFPTKDWDVLILDTYGELFYAYSLSRIAFVGGSLVELGGQNPLEPLLHKNAVIIGSHFSNFKEEVNVLREYKGIIIVNSEEELAEKIIYLFKNDEYRDIIAEKGFQVIDKCKGASERTASFIKEKICYQDQIPASNNEEGITNG